MRSLAVGVAALIALAPVNADAESAEEMRARGEQLAKSGRFSEAIDAFKAAERLEPRARHACLIALAYTRREAWSQAEIFLEQCEARATPADPLPEWVPTAKQQLAERLASVNVAPIEIALAPAGTNATLTVSSFAPDERFTARTIHLPPGRHLIVATAPGFRDAQHTVEVTDRSPQRVVITMEPVTAGAPLGEPTPHVERQPVPPASKVPVAVMGVGAGVGVAGALVHLTLFRGARNDMTNATDIGEYRSAEERFDRYRALSIALYATSAVTVGVGVVLGFTKHKRHVPEVAVVPSDGGAMVSVGWTR
ncbi:MAG: hypothetical protein SFX73_10160 [Kofleriaceae bacterium]|nr:hypothetical protein [Kofleriaceae bacterium]